MSFKDLSPIKQRYQSQNVQTGLFSANNFVDQVESSENVIKQNINTSNNVLLPNIEQKQKKIIKDSSIPTQILEEIYKKRQHSNPNKQTLERRRSSLDKVNITQRNQSCKSYNNMTYQQKNSSLQNFNQSPLSKNVNSKHQIQDVSQNNCSLQNSYNGQQNQQLNSSINTNNGNSPRVLNSSLVDQYQRRNNSNISINNDHSIERKGINSSIVGVNNSILNMSSLINQQSQINSYRNTDSDQILSKQDSQDNLYSKLPNSDKKMTNEIDSQKMKNRILNDQKQILPQRISVSFHSSNQQNIAQNSNIISSSTNKLFQQHPCPISSLNKSKIKSLHYPQKDPSFKDNQSQNKQLQKRNSSEISDFNLKDDQNQTQYSQKNINKDFRSTAASPLRASQNDFQQSILKRNSYINQIIKDEQKKDILGKSDIKEIIGGVQKNFSYFKTAQNNMKKGGERKDIIQLSQWFDDMTIQLLEKDQFTFNTFLEEFEVIYSGCLTEITRQVSNDCFERGQLIEKLWKIILFISKEFMIKTQQKYKLTEMESLQDQKRIHNNYKQQIEGLKKDNANLNKVIEQKDILIRKLYQQKESSKKKSKKFELMHAVLYEDFEFLEKFLVNLNSQNLQMRMKISSLEAQEKLYIKDTDPKQKIKDEINKISSNLIDSYTQQLEEQKQNLQDLYEIKKFSKYKLTVIEKNLDYEFKNGKLEKKGGMDMNAPEQDDDIQLDDDYGQIQMSDQQTDTDDLAIKVDVESSTKDLYTLESTGMMAYIQTEDFEIQVCPTIKEVGTQADIKKILGIEQKGNIKSKESLKELMSDYEELKLPIDHLISSNYRVQQIIQDEYDKWISRNKELVNAFKFKDEYSSDDFEYLRLYLEQNANKVKEFIMESLTSLIKEQQRSIMYKIETFETQLDYQIIKDRAQYQTSTLKKIVPKYNELKKEIILLNQNQVQIQLQQLGQQSNQNFNRKRNISYQFNKQSSLNYLDPYQENNTRQRGQIQQPFQSNYLNKKGNSLKRENTTKFKDEQLSPTKQNTSLSNIKQKSQQNITSNSKEIISPIKLKHDGSQKLINNMKSAISKVSDDYKKLQSQSITSQNLDESQNNIKQLPDISKQLRSITQQAIPNSKQESQQTEQQLNEQINISSERNHQFFQNDRYTKTIGGNQNSSLNSSNTDEKSLNYEKSSEFSNSSNNIQLKKLLQDEIQSDNSSSQTPIQNEQDNKMNEQKINPNKLNKNLNHLELDPNLFNIQEQSEAYEQTMSPPKHQNQKKSTFTVDRKDHPSQIQQNDILVVGNIDNNQQILNQSNQQKLDDNYQNEQSQKQQNEERNNNQQSNFDEIQQSILQQGQQQKKISIIDKQFNLNSDLSSDSDADGKDKPFVTKKDQIQDQVYDKKYLNDAAEEDEINEQAENDEFELALKNLDQNVNNVQPNPSVYSRMRIHASSSKFTDLATEFLVKSLKEMKKKKNSNFFFKLTQILKLVFTILQDIKKGSAVVTLSPTNKNSQPTKYLSINHFHIHLFENLMTSYGTGQMMFKKFFRIINGIFKYKKHPRINIISKFLSGEYDLNDFQLFVKLCNSLYPELQSHEERIIISSQKCYDALNHFLYINFNQKQQENVEKIVQKLRIKGIQKNQFVFDFDSILELIMDYFVKEVKVYKTEEYKDLYFSQDTDKRDYFNYESFKTVLSYIQDQNSVTIANLFYKESDKILNGENLLSLQRFSLICRQNKILSQNIQSKYLELTEEQFLQQLSKCWDEEQYFIKLRLIKVNKYDMKRRKMLNEVDIFLKDSTKSRHSINTIQFIYNLLTQESKQLLVEENLIQLLPQQFLIISQKYDNIIKSKFNHLVEE